MRFSCLSRPVTDWPASLRSGARRHAAALPAMLAALALGGCGDRDVAPDAAEPAPRPVRVVEATAQAAPRQLRLPGALRARQRARLAFLSDGYLAERNARPGDPAKAGQRLAMLYNPSLQPGVAAARADVREARTRLEQLEIDTRRQTTLVERNLISDDQLDQTRTRRDAARATLEQAEAELERALAQFEDATLRAPFAGRVTRVFAEPGDFVRAGEPILALADESALEVEVQFPPAIARALSVDAPAWLQLADSGEAAPARIAEIGRAEPGRPVPVIVRPAAEAVFEAAPGAPVYVHIEHQRSAQPRVPLNAVVDPGTGQARVFRVVDGRAREVSVLIGRLDGGRVEVTGDITAGDRVVVAGQAHLLNGEPVRVLP